MKLKPRSYFLILLILLMLWVISVLSTFPYLEAKLVPLVLSSSILILAVVELVREIRAEKIRKGIVEEEPAKEVEAKVEFWRIGSTLGWLVGVSLGIYILGFFIATTLFVFLYLKVNGRGWSMAICFAMLTFTFMYGVFELGLKAYMYPGLIFS